MYRIAPKGCNPDRHLCMYKFFMPALKCSKHAIRLAGLVWKPAQGSDPAPAPAGEKGFVLGFAKGGKGLQGVFQG